MPYTPVNVLVTGGAGFIGSAFVHHMLEVHPTYNIVVIDLLKSCASLSNLEPVLDNPRLTFVKGDITNLGACSAIRFKRAGLVEGNQRWMFVRVSVTVYCFQLDLRKNQSSQLFSDPPPHPLRVSCRMHARMVATIDMINYTLQQHAIDTIIHFAAETHVDNSFGNSLEFTRSNVQGTHVMLEGALQNKALVKRFVHVSTDEVYGENGAKGEKFSEYVFYTKHHPCGGGPSPSNATPLHFVYLIVSLRK
jgi:dTDP-D-glucose 4,6-dehydratase